MHTACMAKASSSIASGALPIPLTFIIAIPKTIQTSSAKKVASTTQPACVMTAHETPAAIAPHRVMSRPSAPSTLIPAPHPVSPSTVANTLAPKTTRPARRTTSAPTTTPRLPNVVFTQRLNHRSVSVGYRREMTKMIDAAASGITN